MSILNEPAAETAPQAIRWPDAASLERALVKQAPHVAAPGLPAWLLVHAAHCVAWGRVTETGVDVDPRQQDALEPDYVQEFRLFGSLGEWHAWRSGDGFASRLISGETGAPPEAVDEHQALWGTRSASVAQHPGWTELSEDRGVRYCVPLANLQVDDQQPLLLLVRHYLQADPGTHLTAVVDSRLVDLRPSSGSSASLDPSGDSDAS